MNTTADMLIGRYRLKTLKPVTVYNAALQPIGTIPEGRYTPIIDSYIEPGENLHWVFFTDIPGVTTGQWSVKHERDTYDPIPYDTQPPGEAASVFPFEIPSGSSVKKIIWPLAIIAGAFTLYKLLK